MGAQMERPCFLVNAYFDKGHLIMPYLDNWSPKHDLFFMYLCLGHHPDRNMNYKELEIVIRKFRQWLPDIESDEIRKIHRMVIEKYKELGTFENQYKQYVLSATNLKEYFLDKEGQLIEVMNDLISIAREDGSITSNEMSLIKTAVKTWWLKLDPISDSGVEKLKTDIQTNGTRIKSAGEEEKWNSHHDLLYLLICMGHLPDREFSFEEVDAIRRIWSRRYPDMKRSEMLALRISVMNKYNLYENTQDRYNQFLYSALALKEKYNHKRKRLMSILEDLFEVVRADDNINENEIEMLKAVAGLWDYRIELEIKEPLRTSQLYMTENMQAVT